MTSSLLEISDDVNRYLNLDELTTLSTVSTNSFYRGLNNMKYYRFFPYENGEEMLMKFENDKKVKLSDIKASSNLNFVDEYGRASLHWAAYHGCNIEMVKLSIKEGNNNYESSPHNCSPWRTRADVNLVDKYGTTPLHLAVHRRNIEIAKLLINGGGYINVTSNHPLHWRYHEGNIEIAKLLIKEESISDECQYR